MGTKIGLCNDLHLYSSIAWCKPEELIKWIDGHEFVILNGDIIDLAYCPKKDVKLASDFAMLLQARIKAKNNFSEWLEGNHSLFALSKLLGLQRFKYLGEGKYLFHHGHVWCWTPEHVNEFMSKAPGAGWIKGTLGVKLVDLIRKMAKDRPKNMERLAIAEEKKKNPSLLKVWAAHNHPAQDIPYTESGVDVIINSRGFHEIELDL